MDGILTQGFIFLPFEKKNEFAGLRLALGNQFINIICLLKIEVDIRLIMFIFQQIAIIKLKFCKIKPSFIFQQANSDQFVIHSFFVYINICKRNYLEGMEFQQKNQIIFVICILRIAEFRAFHFYFLYQIFYKSNKQMEIHNISKYQNIADRIKRLVNKTNQPQTSNVRDLNLSQGLNHKDKMLVEGNKGFQYQNIFRNPKLSVYENNRQSLQHQSRHQADLFAQSKINQTLISPRQNCSIKRNYKDKVLNFENLAIDDQKQMSRVQSDRNFKLSQILQSLDAYKQNKSKFISTIGKNFTHGRTETDHLSKYSKLVQKDECQISTARCRTTFFRQVVNDCNSRQFQDMASPIFERSKIRYGQGKQLKEKTNNSLLSTQLRPRILSRSKQICRNVIPNFQPRKQGTPQVVLLSPRGPRIAGKICKNKIQFQNYK